MKKFAFGRFILFLTVGLILGTALGIFIGKVFPVFDYGLNAGIQNLNVNLVFIDLSFGLQIKLNVGSVIGAIIFILLFTLT